MSFNNLGLAVPLLKAIQHQGYTHPTKIQQKAIPVVLGRKDVLASAQTGTGKTASFVLPMLQLLSLNKPRKPRVIRALVLTPTRELAAQVHANVMAYGTFTQLKSAVIFGGVKQGGQVSQLRKGVDFLVATPGRLLDLSNQGLLSLDSVEILVLDEADRMLDMGFLRDIKKVLALIPARRQNLLFSATFSPEIRKLARSFMHHPTMIEVTPENLTPDLVRQKIYRVGKKEKTGFLVNMIAEGNWSQVLVFTRTKHGANRLCKKLVQAGIDAAAIHGNKSQNKRTAALAAFKQNKIRVLVATDIAARGLDIPALPHVVNYELPNVPADYVHRIGRTGRAGENGEAVSLVSPDEAKHIYGIEVLLGRQLDSAPVGHEDVGPSPVKDDAPVKKKSLNGKTQNAGRSRRRNNKRRWNRSKRRAKNKGNQSAT
jgi:ATP-dependent RNA helicase RhlE